MSHCSAPNTSETHNLQLSAIMSLCFSLTFVSASCRAAGRDFLQDCCCPMISMWRWCTSWELRPAILQRPVAITSQSGLAARRRVGADKGSIYPELTRSSRTTARHGRHAADPRCSTLSVAFLCLLAIWWDKWSPQYLPRYLFTFSTSRVMCFVWFYCSHWACRYNSCVDVVGATSSGREMFAQLHACGQCWGCWQVFVTCI